MSDQRWSLPIRLLLMSTLVITGCSSFTQTQTPQRQPNVLLVVLDDLGYNDLGVFGSEINTPTMDALARNGTVLSNFHVAPTCSPTRAMLLSGTDSHVAGLGNMAEELAPNQKGQPGYEGYLNMGVAALPEVFQAAGYNTYMTGKWHLGMTPETGPAARGFDHSFVMLQGGAGAFDNMLSIVGPGIAKYRKDGELLEALPKGFYSTEFYTAQMMSYIDAGLKNNDKPFFAYLAYTAPHWPLQAPEKSIARYKGVYDQGYDALRATRLAKAKSLGLVDEDVKAFQRLPDEAAWDDLSQEQKRIEARKMEIYAAMVDDVDRYLGQLINHLKERGEYENTIIVLMSDNGPEAHHLERGWDDLANWVKDCCDNSFENLGKADSYTWYGPNWGIAGNTPSRMFKGFTSQGGVRVPALVHYPGVVKSGASSDALLSVADVMPTLLDLADITPPGDQFGGRSVAAMQGESMRELLQGTANTVHDDDYYIGWELFGKRGLRKGDWKIIYQPYNEIWEPRPDGIKTDQWQLYNLATDPAELYDVAKENPEVLRELTDHWEQYSRDNGVILPDWVSGY